jgi:hypothetical protein
MSSDRFNLSPQPDQASAEHKLSGYFGSFEARLRFPSYIPWFPVFKYSFYFDSLLSQLFCFHF